MLEITNFRFEPLLSCSIITAKLYTVKYLEFDSLNTNNLVKEQKSDYLLYDDKLGSIYVRSSSMHIDDVRSFNSYLKLKGRDIIYRKILEEGELRIYPPLKISSITGKELLITLKVKDVYYELICEKIEISEDNKLKAYYSLPNKLYEFNKYTIKSLNLNATQYGNNFCYILSDKACRTIVVSVSIEFLYSIETFGENYIQKNVPSYAYDPMTWTLNDIGFSEIFLKIDILNRIIYGDYHEYVLVKKYCSRSSNGWEDKYSMKDASFYKKFDLLYNLREYFNDLPRLLESINGFIQINSSENTFLPNEFIIKFNEKLTFSEINKILDFKIEGYEYIQYEETD